MAALRIAGVVLLVLSLAAFVHGGVQWSPNDARAYAAALDLAASERGFVAIPQWMSLGTMVLGAMVLVLGFRRG